MDRPVAVQRVLRGRPASLQFTLHDSQGEAVDAGGAVTVQVDKADGTNVLPAGTATTHGSTGVYSVGLTAVQAATLELLTATWTDVAAGTSVTTLHEIVGGFHFTVAEARASDGTLANSTAYPDQTIRDGRQEVEVEAERIIGAAFVPRYRRLVLDGDGTNTLRVVDSVIRVVRSIRIYSSPTTYLALTSGQLAQVVATDEGLIRRNDRNVFDDGLGNIVVEYEHGLDAPPIDLKRAEFVRLRNLLNFDRAVATADSGDGTYAEAATGPDTTGIPEVDAIYASYADQFGGRGSQGPVSASWDFDPSRLSVFHGGRR